MLHRPRAVRSRLDSRSLGYLSNMLEQHHQNTARNRSSIIMPSSQSANRNRADSGGTTVRSDSDRTEKVDGEVDTVENHPVEPRSRTALLPPIMVSLSIAEQTKSQLIMSQVQNCRRRPYLLVRLPE